MGIVVCMITTLFATDLFQIKSVSEIELSFKRQLLISTIFDDCWHCHRQLFCFAIRIRSLRFRNRELSKIGKRLGLAFY